jgi:anti-sigma factor RsiW
MIKHFAREEWVEYTCGMPSAHLRAQMEEHFATCSECASVASELAIMDLELRSAAKRFREALPADANVASRYEELKDQTALDSDAVWKRVLRLELFLTPICGFHTAQRAMRAAAKRALADSVDSLTEFTWAEFIRHLRSIISALCGEPTACLLWQVGHYSTA